MRLVETQLGPGNKTELVGTQGTRGAQSGLAEARKTQWGPSRSRVTRGAQWFLRKGAGPRGQVGTPRCGRGPGGYLVPGEWGGEAVAVQVAAGAQVGQADLLPAPHRPAPLAHGRRAAPHPPVAVPVIRRRHPGHRLLPAACGEGEPRSAPA